MRFEVSGDISIGHVIPEKKRKEDADRKAMFGVSGGGTIFYIQIRALLEKMKIKAKSIQRP